MATLRLKLDPSLMETGSDRAENALEGVQREARQTESAIDRMASRGGQSSARLGVAVTGMGARMSAARGQIQNTAFQLGDFATQVGAGTSATIALGQQLPQLLGGFGAMGAVAGAAAAVLIPLAGSLISMGDNAETAEKQMEDLLDAVDRYRNAVQAAIVPTSDLTEEFGRNASRARELLHIEQEIERIEAIRSLATASQGISGFFDIGMLDSLAGYAGTAQGEIRKLRDSLDLSHIEATRLYEAFQEIGKAEGWRETASALRAAREQIELATGGLSEMDDETFAVYRQMLNAEKAAIRIAAETEKAEEAAENMKQTRLNDFMADTAVRAKDFADELARAFGFADGISGLNFDSLNNRFGGMFSDWMNRAEGMQSAQSLIMAKEGFRANAYWDVNHYRAGYGSDTYTDAQGAVRPVTKGTTVSMADAERDMQRRINTYFTKVIDEIGMSAFDALSAAQQGALASILHNYGAGEFRQGGDLGQVLAALKTGNNEFVAQRIAELGSHNNGVNRDRRREEARAFGRADSTITADNEAQKAATEAAREAERAEKERAQALKDTRTAYDGLASALSPLTAAAMDYENAQETVNAALKAGYITADEASQAMVLAQERYQDAAAAARGFGDVWQDISRAGGSAIDRLIDGTTSLKEAAIDAVKEIVLLITKQNLLRSVKGGEKGDSLGTLIFKGFLGGFDSGGLITPGSYGIVGERGPEVVSSTARGAVVTSRADTARTMGSQQGGILTGEIGVTVDDDGKLQAYVKRMGVQAAKQGAAQAVQSVRRNLDGWNREIERDGAIV